MFGLGTGGAAAMVGVIWRVGVSGLIIVAALLGLTLLTATSAWRWMLRPLCIRPHTMSAAKLGFQLADSQDRDLVNGVCGAFAGGFNAMIASPSAEGWSRFADGQPTLFQPFAQEGAAMGYSLRHLGRFSADRFERDMVARYPGYRYLHYVGLGFWHAMRDRPPEQLERIVDQLDPLHAMLCWDGYGFKFGFFDYEDQTKWKTRFDRLEGYARNVAYQGLGRSLWFRFMGRTDDLIKHLYALGPHVFDGASGVALAAVFTTIDRPQRAFDALRQMPEPWHTDILLGMCFAYQARSINHPDFFEQALRALDAHRRVAVRDAIERCDEVEGAVRHRGGPDGYRRWRQALKPWLAQHVRFPFEGLSISEEAAPRLAVAPA